MPSIFDSIVILLIILVLARLLKRGSPLLQQYFIPSSLVAGIGGLILGPQLIGAIPTEVTEHWATFPKYLINVVFAGLFLGHAIPSISTIWRNAGPMLAFGNTLAWGQYVLGIALTMFFLTPVFGTHPLAGSLIEIGFEGGHGTAAGLAPTFEQLGWAEGTDLALGLATISILVAITSGILIINLYNRHHGRVSSPEQMRKQQQQMIRSGYSLVRFTSYFSSYPKTVFANLLAFAAAIGIGWLLLQGFVAAEAVVLSPFTDLRFFAYVPLFPLAMIGGLIVQLLLRTTHRTHLIHRRTSQIISAISLDLLILSAVATISLSVIGDNLPTFLTLAIAGIAWILGSFFLLAPRMFSTYWFEKGLTNTGQSMGMTATGLLMNRLVDPGNKTGARESFAYKQLAFEPFMGGGLVTASAAIIIAEFGSLTALIGASFIMLFWLMLGLQMGRKRRR